MRKTFFFFAVILLCLASCNSSEKIVYFQDTIDGETYSSLSTKALKLAPGDKVGVTVTSAATPELAYRYNLSMGQGNSNSNSNIDNLRYTIDENGNIDMLGIGRTKIAGMTRSEAAMTIQNKFRNGILNDAVVTIGAYNQYITILGEVAKPGRLEIDRDNITILEAIGAAGDLTITGRRDRVKVFRQEGNESKTYYVDLRSKDIFNSPVYNLQQNDVIYVEPNKLRVGQSTNNDNSVRQISTWLSVTSVIISICILIFN